MSWDPVWEGTYRSRDWGRYPPEELIRFVARTYGDIVDRSAVRILELGCGTGANLWYLAREGYRATGIDGSATAVEKARARLAAEQLHAELIEGDFTDLSRHVAAGTFDAVVDVSSVQHNRLAAATTVFEQTLTALRPGGRVMSMLLAAGSWGDGAGAELEPGTFAEITEGPLVGMGVAHFFELDEVARLFAGYVDVEIEYTERSLDGRRHSYRHWVVTAARPG